MTHLYQTDTTPLTAIKIKTMLRSVGLSYYSYVDGFPEHLAANPNSILTKQLCTLTGIRSRFNASVHKKHMDICWEKERANE
jgi:hypothetical protein